MKWLLCILFGIFVPVNSKQAQQALLDVRNGIEPVASFEALSLSFSGELSDCKTYSFRRSDPIDACTPLKGNMKGQYILIERGQCTFLNKALLARRAGAAGIIFINNQDKTFFVEDNSAPLFTIPVVMVTITAGERLLQLDDVKRERSNRYQLRLAREEVCSKFGKQNNELIDKDDLTLIRHNYKEISQSETKTTMTVANTDVRVETDVDMSMYVGTNRAIKSGNQIKSNNDNIKNSVDSNNLREIQDQNRADSDKIFQSKGAPPLNQRALRMQAKLDGRARQNVVFEDSVLDDEGANKNNMKTKQGIEYGLEYGYGSGGHLIVSWDSTPHAFSTTSYWRSERVLDYLTVWYNPNADVDIKTRTVEERDESFTHTDVLYVPNQGSTSSTYHRNNHVDTTPGDTDTHVSHSMVIYQIPSGLSTQEATAHLCRFVASNNNHSPAGVIVGLSPLLFIKNESVSSLNVLGLGLSRSSGSSKSRSLYGYAHGHLPAWSQSLCTDYIASPPLGLKAIVMIPALQGQDLVRDIEYHMLYEKQGQLNESKQLMVYIRRNDSVFDLWDSARSLGEAALIAREAGSVQRGVGKVGVHDQQWRRVEQRMRDELHPNHPKGCLDRFDSLHRLLSGKMAPEARHIYKDIEVKLNGEL